MAPGTRGVRGWERDWLHHPQDHRPPEPAVVDLREGETTAGGGMTGAVAARLAISGRLRMKSYEGGWRSGRALNR